MGVFQRKNNKYSICLPPVVLIWYLCLWQDIIPYLVLHQHSRKPRPGVQHALPATAASANENAENGQRGSSDNLERVDSLLPPTTVAGAASMQPHVVVQNTNHAPWTTESLCTSAGACMHASYRHFDRALLHCTGQNFMALSHSAAAEEEQSRGNWYCGAFVVGKDNYCARTSTLQAFCEVNRWALWRFL